MNIKWPVWAVISVACVCGVGLARAADQALSGVILQGTTALETKEVGQAAIAQLRVSASVPAGQTTANVPNAGISFAWPSQKIVVEKQDVTEGDAGQAGTAPAPEQWSVVESSAVTVSAPVNGEAAIPPDGEGKASQEAQLSASFDQAGRYRIKIIADASWWSGTGNYYRGPSNELTVSMTVQEGEGTTEPPVVPPNPNPTPTPTPVVPPVVPPGPGPGPNPNPTPTPTPVTPPALPAISLNAEATDATTIELSWSGSAGTLYRSQEKEFAPSDETHIDRGDDESDDTKLSYTDRERTPATLYYYILVPKSPNFSQGKAQAETPDLDAPSVTFVDQNARACAGGIAGDDVHTFTITGTAKRKDENGDEKIVTEGTTLELSFENNRGHDYGDGRTKKNAKFVPNSSTQHPQTIVDGSDGEQMTVTTDDKGQFKLSVLSSDIISTDIKVKIKWKNAKGEAKDVGSQKCDFVKVESKRRYGIVFGDQGASDDQGWEFDPGLFDGPGSVVPGAYKIKFLRDPSITPDDKYFTIPGVNPGDEPTSVASVYNPNGGENEPFEIFGAEPRLPLNDTPNWAGVSGHKIEIRISEIQPHESASLSSSELSDYAYFVDDQNFVLNADGQRALDGNGQPFTDPSAIPSFSPVASVTLNTDASGGVTFFLGAGSRIDEAKKVLLKAENKTQY